MATLVGCSEGRKKVNKVVHAVQLPKSQKKSRHSRCDCPDIFEISLTCRQGDNLCHGARKPVCEKFLTIKSNIRIDRNAVQIKLSESLSFSCLLSSSVTTDSEYLAKLS